MSKDQIHGKQIEDASIARSKLVGFPPLDNFNATVDPTVNDDDTQGYGPGSGWLNTTTGTVFQCLSNATGAAVWRNRTPLFDYDYLVGPVGLAPFQTIQAAIDQAASDGGWTRDIQARVGILNGVYTENVSIPGPWYVLEAVDVFANSIDLYPTDQRVKIIGTVTFTVSISGVANDITMYGIKVAPTTGPALHVAGGDYVKRVHLFNCFLVGSSNSDVITYSTLVTKSVTIWAVRSKAGSQPGYLVMNLTTGGRFYGLDCTPMSGTFLGPAFRLSGNGWLALIGRSVPSYGIGSVFGQIEVLAGTVNNTLVLDGAGFWRRGTEDVIVDGTLTASSFWKHCYAAIYPTSNTVEMVIAGTNAASFKELPGGNAGDIRRYDGDRWQTVSVPALDGDYDIPALTTTGDYQIAMTPAISRTPEFDVLVRVNGVAYKPARNQTEKTTSPCYFSNDGGGTVTTIGSIVGAVDKLYWVGSVAGFQLAAADRIDLVYEV